MDQVTQYWANARDNFPVLLGLGGNLVSALLIFIAGLTVGRWLSRRLRRSRFGGSHLDATLRPVLASVLFYVILSLTLYAVLIKIGVPPTALVAVFGAAGLAIGLALRDTLANIAAGVMLLILRPLKVGEFVEINGTLGTVEEIGLFNTNLRNLENLAIYLPNSQIWGNRVMNYGRHAARKVNVEIGVSYDTDLDRAREILLGVLSAQDGLLPFDPAVSLDEDGLPLRMTAATPPEVYVMAFADSAITLSCRCWLPGDGWLARASTLRMDIKRALDAADIEIPFPQRVVHYAKGNDPR